MLATIVAPVSSTFDAFNQLSWLVTTYAIGSAISQPLSGHLTDIFGRRAGLALCYFLFIIGTLFCGLSFYTRSLGLFLSGRIVQGLGGGSLCSITSFIESDLVPLEKRALIEGIGNVAFGATLAIGGAYGGGIHDSIGWQWAFFIQVPFILVNAIMVIFSVRIPRRRHRGDTTETNKTSKRKSIDYVGCITILITMTLFQYGINSGSSTSTSTTTTSKTSWTQPGVLTPLILSLISLVICLYWDTYRSSNPVIPISSLGNRTIASSTISFFFASAATSAIFYYVPIYLQLILGVSTRNSGIYFIPYAVAFCIGSSGVGYVVKKLGRYFHVNILVQACLVAGTTCLCTLDGDRDQTKWKVYVYLVLLGAGFGGAYVTRLMGLLSSAEPEKQAVVQAASWAVSSMGSTVGITGASALFQGLKEETLREAVGGDEKVLQGLVKMMDFAVLGGLRGEVRDAVVGVYLEKVRGVFYFALAAIVVSAVASLGMRNNDLKKKKGEKSALSG